MQTNLAAACRVYVAMHNIPHISLPVTCVVMRFPPDKLGGQTAVRKGDGADVDQQQRPLWVLRP
eukprot:11603227-Prorocentrum_lima.AAC.1